MADGQAPDNNAAMLAWQQQLNAQAASGGGGGKHSILTVAGLRDADVFASLSVKGKGLNIDKPLPALFASTGGKQGGIADKVLQAMMSACDDFKKCAQNAGVMYTGNVTNGAPVNSGSSFADSSAPGPSGGISV